ncbi:MAG: hypothetical protein ACK5RS_13260 [Acidobacteriota bacterium]
MKPGGSNRGEQLVAIISQVRRRRHLLVWMKGIALTAAITAGAILLLGLVTYRFRYSDGLVIGLRLLSIGAVAAAVFVSLWRPLRRRVEDRQIARLIEERVPGLEERLVTAVEVANQSASAPSTLSEKTIHNRLIEEADSFAARIGVDEVVPRQRLLNWAGALLLAATCFVGVIFYGPRELRVGLAELVSPAGALAKANALGIELRPEGGRVARGTDQRITARFINFTPDEATFYFRKAGAGDDQWIGQPMEPARRTDEFQYLIFNIQDDTEYFVEAPGCRSEIFKLTVVDRPLVKRLDQRQV